MEKDTHSEIEKMLEKSVFIENGNNKISIELPAKYMRKHLTEKQLQKVLDEIGIMIDQKLRNELRK